ncbi:MAG: chalcone isomerase family protein [Pseudomonadota bacterium]|nr:chalcone isomerase family protein [Pseudomonadota bacterium]
MLKTLIQTFCVLMVITFSTQALSQVNSNLLSETTEALESNDVTWNKVSSGTATWFFMDIYEATLYANQSKLPTHFLQDGIALKLQLCYLKSITPDIFIEGANAKLPENLSIELKQEVARLHQAYQAVEPGDCYDLEYTQNRGTHLKFNGQSVFSSAQPDFKSVYFGIWLGDNPLSEPLKQSLIGD